MSQNQFVFRGLDEFKRDLRALPSDLADEAGQIVTAAADAAGAEIAAAYPTRTGNLREHVKVEHSAPAPFGRRSVVKSTARHALLFENGTQARHTDLGANRGTMPPGHVFVPRILRARRRMYQELKALMVRHGLRVSGVV